MKAHVADSPDLSSRERFLKTGNDLADTVAKSSLSRHPQPNDDEIRWLNRVLKVSKAVANLSCDIMPLWPRLDLKGIPLDKKPRASQCKESGLTHHWVRFSTFWQCEACLRVSRGVRNPQPLDPTRLDPPPPGACVRPPLIDPRALRQRKHRCIALACSDNALLIVCTKCKAYSSHGHPRNLSGNCNLAPQSNGARSAWSSICKGKHPKYPGVSVERGPWSVVWFPWLFLLQCFEFQPDCCGWIGSPCCSERSPLFSLELFGGLWSEHMVQVCSGS